MNIRKTLLFLLVSLNIFPKTYEINDLLSLYEKNSYQSKVKEVNSEKNEIKLKEFDMSLWKDLNLEMTPVFTKINNETTKLYGINLSYQNIFYKVNLDEKSKKTSESYGYGNNFYQLFFERGLNRKILNYTIEINSLEEKENVLVGKKLLIEKIFKLKLLQWQKRIIKETLAELTKEKEILEKKLTIGEASFFHMVLNEKEKIGYENLAEKTENDLELINDEIRFATGIEDEFSVNFDMEKTVEIKKKTDNIKIIELNKNINEEKMKEEKLNLIKTIDFSYEYDNIEKSSVVSAKFLYKPFENSGKKMLLLEKEELIIKEKEGKNNANNDYETKSNTLKFLIKESARLENFNKSYRVFYEEMKTRFEKGNISYDDFMKIKKDYRTVEEELIKTQIELEKFIVNEKE